MPKITRHKPKPRSKSRLLSTHNPLKNMSRNRLLPAIAGLAVAAVGIITLLTSRASTGPQKIEAEGGSRSGNIGVIADTTASGGSYIIFKDQTTTTSQPPPSPGFSTTPGRVIPDTLYGVTTETIDNLSALNASLTKHSKRPITRIVFQNKTTAPDYTVAVDNLRRTSYIMGEILDSTSLKSISVANYRARTASFVNTYKNTIDIYEIGNELNGEWVGTPSTILPKLQAAYDVVEKDNASLNLKSAITLNFWPSNDCYSYSWEDTESFANSIPLEIRNGTDYIFLSFYETACSPRAKPTNEQFIAIFSKMKSIFPNAKIGMGEIGAQGKDDGLPTNPSLSEKQALANRYYGMHNALKASLGNRYVGGYFWWYYYQDAVPFNKLESLWPTIEANFNTY